MINIGNRELNAVYIGNIPIISIYIGNELIWPTALSSCFASGYWVDEYPWTDDFQWTD